MLLCHAAEENVVMVTIQSLFRTTPALALTVTTAAIIVGLTATVSTAQMIVTECKPPSFFDPPNSVRCFYPLLHC